MINFVDRSQRANHYARPPTGVDCPDAITRAPPQLTAFTEKDY